MYPYFVKACCLDVLQRYFKVALCADISDCRIFADLSSISVGSNHKHIFDAA